MRLSEKIRIMTNIQMLEDIYRDEHVFDLFLLSGMGPGEVTAAYECMMESIDELCGQAEKEIAPNFGRSNTDITVAVRAGIRNTEKERMYEALAAFGKVMAIMQGALDQDVPFGVNTFYELIVQARTLAAGRVVG